MRDCRGFVFDGEAFRLTVSARSHWAHGRSAVRRAASRISFPEAARHAGKRADGICDRVTLGSRVLTHALNLADAPSRRAFSSLTLSAVETLQSTNA
jgi:hypothetical protein